MANNLKIESAWGGGGREPVIVVYEDGVRVASFDTEAEAESWVDEEYGEGAYLGAEAV